MNRQIAFMLVIFPTFFAGFLVLLLYCINRGWITVGSPSPGGNVFMFVYVFAWAVGAFSVMLLEELETQK